MDNNKRLFVWAERRGINDAQLAAKMGMDRSAISRLRSGERAVSHAVAWRFGQAFGFGLADELFQFESVADVGRKPVAI